MTTISYTDARKRLATIWDETEASCEPVIFSRRGKKSMVMLPLDEWRSIEETAYLLRSPANARRLLGALNRISRGEYETFTMDELRAKLHLN